MAKDKNEQQGGAARNRLVGWLVSYARDEQGAYHEIRSGRTLISAEKSSDTRIITVTERDISAPHLAMSASVRHRVLIQDIFSERGSYLTRADGTSETKVTGPIEVEHGDWLRIGDGTRFQVCLIDGPGR